jgi:hypothetical protein
MLPTKTIIGGYMVESLSKNELIYRADLIVKGTVKKIVGCEWSNPENVLGNDVINEIKTYYLIEIKEIFKGSSKEIDIVVETNGGKLDKTVYINNSSPKLIINEEVLLFLFDRTEENHLDKYPITGSYGILGFKQGKYTLQQDGIYRTVLSNQENSININDFYTEINYAMNEYATTRRPDLTREEIREINRQSMGE